MSTRLPGKTKGLAEAKAGPLTDRLGGEERVERLLDDLLRHAAAGIRDRNHHILSGRDVVFCRVSFVDMSVCCLDRQLAAVRHRVTRIDGEVEHRVFELVRIGLGPRLTKGRGQDLGHVSNQLVGIDSVRRKRLLSRKRHGVKSKCGGMDQLISQTSVKYRCGLEPSSRPCVSVVSAEGDFTHDN